MLVWMSVALAGWRIDEAVVVEPERGVAYVASPGGGISAVRIADGERLWHSTEADLPLDATAERLVAWEGSDPRRVRVVVFGARGGSLVYGCEGLDVPEGMTFGLDRALGEDSQIAARLQGVGLAASWQSVMRYVGGVQPLYPAADRAWSGEGRCGPDGRWQPGEGPPLDSLAVEIPKILEGKVGMGMAVGGLWLAALPDPAGGVLRLYRWDLGTGERRPSFLLGPYDPQRPSNGYLSEDGRLVAAVAGGDSTVFDTSSGAKIAAIAGAALTRFAKVGDVYVVGPGLGGAEIVGYGADGRERWRAPIRIRGYPIEPP